MLPVRVTTNSRILAFSALLGAGGWRPFANPTNGFRLNLVVGVCGKLSDGFHFGPFDPISLLETQIELKIC
jgi:hypothetical protein